MSYKTILACLPDEACAEEILPAACTLAASFGAHLVGLHTLDPIVPYPGIALHIDDPRFKAFNDAATAADQAIEEQFRAAIAAYGVEGEWRSLRAGSPSRADDFVLAAFRADLVVTAMPDQDGGTRYLPGIEKDLIVHSGRPVLLVPPAWHERPIGTRVLIAWKATREASLAVRGALPFLGRASEVGLVTVGPPHEHTAASETDGHEMARMLSRHGVGVTVEHLEDDDGNAGRRILEACAQHDCDLVVMGACGHSRLHGFLMRDATFTVLKNARVPVLMAH